MHADVIQENNLTRTKVIHTHIVEGQNVISTGDCVYICHITAFVS